MEEIRKINEKYQIKIEQDDYCESPDNWEDTELFLIFDHSRFNIEREGFDVGDIEDYLCCLNEIEKAVKNDDRVKKERYENTLSEYTHYNEDYFIFPVSAYIHSGVSLSLTSSSFKCPWDTSHNGFILVKKDMLKGSSKHEKNLTLEEAQKYAENLIETWNEYLSGEVYCIELQKVKQFQKHYLDGEIDHTIHKEFVTIDSLGEVYKSNLEECIENILQTNNIIKE